MPRLAQPLEGEASAWSPRGGWFSSSMGRGLAILECFSPARPVLRIVDIADELGMKPSTIHRYLSSLLALGYVEQDATHRYCLALAVTRLGLSAMSAGSLREHAHPYLQELSRQTSYATAIAILDGPEILYIDQLPSPHRGQSPIDLVAEPRLPAYCTAMGKVLLASLPPDEQETLVAELKLKRHTPNTITSKTELRTELNTVAERGHRRQRPRVRSGRAGDRRARTRPVRSRSGHLHLRPHIEGRPGGDGRSPHTTPPVHRRPNRRPARLPPRRRVGWRRGHREPRSDPSGNHTGPVGRSLARV
jgi:IclR family transcriptional regulator, pca regulon regulatory protein